METIAILQGSWRKAVKYWVIGVLYSVVLWTGGMCFGVYAAYRNADVIGSFLMRVGQQAKQAAQVPVIEELVPVSYATVGTKPQGQRQMPTVSVNTPSRLAVR